MHELSIAHSLVSLAAGAAEKAGVARVSAVHLRLGALSGVVEDALRFGFAIAAAGTSLADARLEIEPVPVQVHCAACGATAQLPTIQSFRCPRCGAPTADVRAGRELDLVALEYDDPDPPAGGLAEAAPSNSAAVAGAPAGAPQRGAHDALPHPA